MRAPLSSLCRSAPDTPGQASSHTRDSLPAQASGEPCQLPVNEPGFGIPASGTACARGPMADPSPRDPWPHGGSLTEGPGTAGAGHAPRPPRTYPTKAPPSRPPDTLRGHGGGHNVQPHLPVGKKKSICNLICNPVLGRHGARSPSTVFIWQWGYRQMDSPQRFSLGLGTEDLPPRLGSCERSRPVGDPHRISTGREG